MYQKSNGERPSSKEIGNLGEQLAVLFLKKNKYKVLYRNYRASIGGEIDVVVRDQDTLVFVEVKTRVGDPEEIRPADAVTSEKKKYIVRGASSWLRELPEVVPFRFDIVEVVLTDGKVPYVHLCEDAFQMPNNYYI